ncbi:hypothetical protein D5086_011432, partial [Populus alba]
RPKGKGQGPVSGVGGQKLYSKCGQVTFNTLMLVSSKVMRHERKLIIHQTGDALKEHDNQIGFKCKSNEVKRGPYSNPKRLAPLDNEQEMDWWCSHMLSSHEKVAVFFQVILMG